MLRRMSVDELRAKLEKGEPLTVLDIRDPESRAEWSIPGSLHAMDVDVEALPKDRPVVAVCYHGSSSVGAAMQLDAMGFEAWSLDGGMAGWSLAWNLAEVPTRSAAVTQVRRTGKGCLSYVVASRGKAAVIDPSLPVEVYMDLAKRRNLAITHVLETHVHADHLSRAKALAERAWAKLILPETNRVNFARETIRDDQAVVIGDAELRVVAAPGHTAEGICYRLGDEALFTGDTLFPDAVGRPDLAASADEARMRAATLHGTLTRLLALPDEMLVLPAHADAPLPFDGASHTATIRAARAVLAPRLDPRETFVAGILQRLPPPPPNARRIVAFNESGVLPEEAASNWEAGANRCAVR